MDNLIKNWYLSVYDDDLGNEIDDSLTFTNLIFGMMLGTCVYDLLGVGDSLIRERVFAQIAQLLNVPYESIYSIWLHPNYDEVIISKMLE